ncbi:MAG: hypothetical protein VR64_24885 [Desulfatitalea sp. BRH_c12]|nr:MAG: hypothetical protein VR64_24885 [Desulfatitalea sp. BRH_c12]
MNSASSKQIYSISKLTSKIKVLLEVSFPMVWITGEISNLKIPGSGHAYFTLKDAQAQIAGVMFRAQRRQLKFDLSDGLTIVALGRISVYEPRGTYQIILEYVEPKGAGALQLAFEQLKNKLSQEGLFDNARKRPIPFLPDTICIITSPRGAVIHDLLNVLNRRFCCVAVEILPVRVQGEGAVEEIAKAIRAANRRKRAKVIILARGGGSLEDLAAFNSEDVARAIFNSDIPVISAVGHETDVTIADFVADMRAPTPSAAAELVVPVRSELLVRCAVLHRRCLDSINKILSNYRKELRQHSRALVHPKMKVQSLQMRVDDLSERLHRAGRAFVYSARSRKESYFHKLLITNPVNYLNRNKAVAERSRTRLHQAAMTHVIQNKTRLSALSAALKALSPQAVLDRGYSITRTKAEKSVLTRADEAKQGQALEILLAKGTLNVTVEDASSDA